MRSYLEMLLQRNLSTLWASQVLSAVGDQLHMIAVVWISVQMAGAKAGFVVSAGAIAGLVVGLFAGQLADRWDRRTSMIVCDVMRGLTVAAVGIAAQAGALQLWHLAAVGVVCTVFTCLFEPCMLASMPTLAKTPAILRAMNSLMMMTFRLARLIGPALAGWLLSFLPIYTFFYVDSLSYFVSALAIWILGKNYQWRPIAAATGGGARAVVAEIYDAATMACRNRELFEILGFSLVCGSIWAVIYFLGFPLLVKQSHFIGVRGVGAYATLICCYGVGNVISNIAVGTLELDKRPAYNVALGYVVMGFGFVVAASSPNLAIACLGCAIAAVGGPISDVATVNFFARLPDEYRGKINSLQRFVYSVGSAVGLLAAPMLFSVCLAQQGITYGAVIMAILGVIGVAFGRRRSAVSGNGHVRSEAVLASETAEAGNR